MDKKYLTVSLIILIIVMIFSITGLVIVKLVSIVEEQDSKGRKTVLSPNTLIRNYACTAVDALEKAIEADNYRLAIVPFNGTEYVEVRKLNDYDGPGNSDERYFEDCLYEQSLVSKKFTVVTRNKLNKALEELTLQAKDIFDPSTAKRVGKFMGVDLLIVTEGYIGKQGRKGYVGYGRQPFDLDYGVIRITCSLIDVETAEIKAIWNRFDRM